MKHKSLFILILLLVGVATGLFGQWQYSKDAIINQTANAGTGYQVRFVVNYNSGTTGGEIVNLQSKCKTDFGDLRFFEGATELDYWMESMTTSSNAVFWVELAGNLTDANRTVTLKYGYPSATTTSNGPNTFAFFDDFSGDLSKWTRHKVVGVYPQISGGYVRCGGGTSTAGTNTFGHTVLGSSATYSAFQNNAIEYRYKQSATTIGEVSFRGVFGTDAGYKARSDGRTGTPGNNILIHPYYYNQTPFISWAEIANPYAGGAFTVDQWYRGTLTAYQSSLKLYRNGTLNNSVTDATYAGAGEISLQNHFGTYSDYDWVAVRKFAGTEPTRGSWGGDVVLAPTTQSSNLVFSSIDTTSLTASWTNGNGLKRVVLINTSNSFTAPTDGTDPSANTVWANTGQQVVYNNSSNSVPITGLTDNTPYWFRVYEYNGSGAATVYLTTTATDNPKSVQTLSAYDYPPYVPTTFNGLQINVTSTSLGGGLDYIAPTLPPIPNPSFTMGGSFALSATGVISFTLTTTDAFGAYWQNGQWYSIPAAGGTITFNVDFDVAKAVIQFVTGDADVTLPVELTSFTAIFTVDFFIKLHWTTQSETGVTGFYIYRNTANDISGALAVSPLVDATNTSDQHEYEYTDTELFEPGTYYYWLGVQNMDGTVNYHGPTTAYFDNSGNHGAPGIPVRSGLNSVYPNPFNPSTTINYGLTKNADVTFTIYNPRGQVVRTINEGQRAAGNWKVFWDGLDNNSNTCSTGVYFIRMNAGKDSFVRKAVLMK